MPSDRPIRWIEPSLVHLLCLVDQIDCLMPYRIFFKQVGPTRQINDWE
jgi:hypothetical protein